MDITIDRLTRDLIKYEPIQDSYSASYPEFLKYFNDINGQLTDHHLVIGSHFVYGWMPTIVKLKISELGEVLTALNKAKAGGKLKADELVLLKKCINNSIVGASKLLHFINPNIYAIWDSRIHRYSTGKKSQYSVNNSQTYLNYLNTLWKLIDQPEFSHFYQQVLSKYPYKISKMRALEIVMFDTDRRTNKNMI